MTDPSATDRPLGIAGAITRAFIGSPLTPLLLLAALVVGLIALITLPREEEPQISVPMVDILVQADGLKAADAAKLVTEPLETILRGIDGVEHVYSRSMDDRVLVTARFLVGTDSDAAILRVHEKVRANLDRIPVGIPEPLIVGRGINDVAVATLTLTPTAGGAGQDVDAAQLTKVARELLVEIAKIDNVGLSYLVGEVETRIRIAPRLDRLALYGVTLQQLAGKVGAANRAFPAGRVQDRGQEITLVAGNTLATPDEIGNLPLVTRDGRTVYVRDVADVGFATDPEGSIVSSLTRDGGRVPAVTLAFAKRPGANAVLVTEAVIRRAEALRGTVIPTSMAVQVTRDYGHTALEKSNELLFHLGLATLSIVALILLAIGWREAVVVAVVIPVTILLTLFAANTMGYTLNRVSLFALIFSIGILVDDAIVVIENITRHWAMGDGRARSQAAIDAVAEVGNPTIVATLTVVAALLPMLFVSGLMGPYMSPIPANASAAMIFSFFVAVIVTPWLMMKIAGRVALAHHGGGDDGGRLGRLYRALARPVLKSRGTSWFFLLVTLALTLGSLLLFYTRDVTVKLLPFDNKSELSVMIDLPEGGSLETTDAVAQRVARAALEIPEVTATETYAGTAGPFDFNGLVRHYFQRQSPELGDVHIELAPKGERKRESHAIALDLRARLAKLNVPEGTSLKVVETPPGPPVLATLMAEVYGPDPETRREVAARLRQIFASVPFIVDVDDSFGAPGRRVRAILSGDGIEFYRVEESDVFDTLALLNHSRTVGYSHRGDGRAPVPIVLERPRSQRMLGPEILGVPVPANALPGDRGVVELGDVVGLKAETASYPIYRHNALTAEMVTAELAGEFEAPLYGMLAVQDAIDRADWGDLPKPAIRLHGQPEDESKVTLVWDGEWDVTWITFRDMGAAFMVALLGIYVLVVAQFGSFRLPLVILTPIPLTFIGILGGHWLLGAPFTATSMIGFIALAGIIVRNSILLVDFIRHTRRPGLPLRDVLIEAGSIRFKPILLTALAAMIGAAVILSDPIFQGLAISLLFGLASSTLLTILVIPAIYMALRGPRAG